MSSSKKFIIIEDDLRGAATQALLTSHLAQMRANSPADASFALDLAALRAPNINFWSAWHNNQLAGIGALKTFANGTSGEIKSMRTAPQYLRQGVARAMLEHIIGCARQRGLHQLSLETGRGPTFTAALALYQSFGFQAGAPFADYAPSAFNQYFHLQLCQPHK